MPNGFQVVGTTSLEDLLLRGGGSFPGEFPTGIPATPAVSTFEDIGAQPTLEQLLAGAAGQEFPPEVDPLEEILRPGPRTPYTVRQPRTPELGRLLAEAQAAGMPPAQAEQLETQPMVEPFLEAYTERRTAPAPERRPTRTAPVAQPKATPTAPPQAAPTAPTPKPRRKAPDEAPAEAPQRPGMEDERRAQILRGIAGLQRAGGRVPTTAEMFYGTRVGGPPREPTELLERAAQFEKRALEAQQREEEAGGVIRDTARRVAKSMGLDPNRIRNDVQGANFMKAAGQEQELRILEAKRDEATREKVGAKEQAALLAQGDIAGLPQKQKEALTKLEGELLKNDQYKKNVGLVYLSDRLEELLSMEDKRLAAGMAPIILARIAGEVGNLAQAEQAAYKKLPGLPGELLAVQEWFTGMPTEDRIGAMRTILNALSEHAKKPTEDIVNRFSKRFTNLYKDAPADAIQKHLTEVGVPEGFKVGETPTEKLPEGQVYVRGKDGGKYGPMTQEEAQGFIDSKEATEIIR